MSKEGQEELLPVVDYMRIPDDGEPYLMGLKCRQCGAVFLDQRKHCARCAATDSMEPYRLGGTGVVYAHSIVERSYPGIPVPFASAVVDLDGGGTVKSNLVLRSTDDRKAVQAGLKVRINFEKAPWGDENGQEYMLFNFEMTGEQS